MNDNDPEDLLVSQIDDDPPAAVAAVTEALTQEIETLAVDIGTQSFHFLGAEAALLRAADAAAGRVRAETALAEQPVSIATSALLVARYVHGALDRRGALLIGLGEMSEVMAAEFIEAGIGNLVVTHPSAARVEAAARRLGCHFRPWDELDDALNSADIVVAAMGLGRYTVTATQVEAALKCRRREPIFLIDAAVPGDVDPAVASLGGAYLYDFEDLERVALEGKVNRAPEWGADK